MTDPSAASIHLTLSKLADQCMTEANYNVEKARAKMWKILSDDDELFRKLANPIVNSAITTACRNILSTVRETVAETSNLSAGFSDKEAPKEHKKKAPQRKLTVISLYDWVIEGGITLGEATKEQLEVSAKHLCNLGDLTSRRGQWQMMIAQRMSKSGCVREQLTEDELMAAAEQVGGLH